MSAVTGEAGGAWESPALSGVRVQILVILRVECVPFSDDVFSLFNAVGEKFKCKYKQPMLNYRKFLVYSCAGKW